MSGIWVKIFLAFFLISRQLVDPSLDARKSILDCCGFHLMSVACLSPIPTPRFLR